MVKKKKKKKKKNALIVQRGGRFVSLCLQLWANVESLSRGHQHYKQLYL